MSIYIISDVHGCYDELRSLLKKINFKVKKDQLIFVGDLINRGGQSLKVLRFIKNLGSSAHVVLGNHDVTLIAYYANVFDRSVFKNDEFSQIIKAKDIDEIILWLRNSPLLIDLEKYSSIVVHAGISPNWSVKKAKKKAKKAEKILKSNKYMKYLKYAYKTKVPEKDKVRKIEKFKETVNYLTRVRNCYINGEMNFYEKKYNINKKLFAWFELREKFQVKEKNTKIIFGHWASLGYYKARNVICIDSGCCWGGNLTALKLSKGKCEKIQVKRLKKPGRLQ